MSQTSADPYEYEDSRGIRIADSDWECPNCGNHGELMYRPGSKETCATCFWVVDGQNNDYEMNGWGLTFPEARKLLAAADMDWAGTPGRVGTRLRELFSEDVAGAQEAISSNDSIDEQPGGGGDG